MPSRKSPQPPKATETQITNSIREYLKARGIWHFKVHGGAMQKRGLPDLLGCLPDGRLLGLEMKRPDRATKPRGGCTVDQWDNLHDIPRERRSCPCGLLARRRGRDHRAACRAGPEQVRTNL